MNDFPNFITIKTGFDTGKLSVDNVKQATDEGQISQDQYKTITGHLYPVETLDMTPITDEELALMMGVTPVEESTKNKIEEM